MKKLLKSKWMYLFLAVLVFILMPQNFPIIAFIVIFFVFYIIFIILWNIGLSLLGDDKEEKE